MDNTREELINLLCKFSLKQNWLLAVANLADYLIANGVTVLPCKIGDDVYLIPTYGGKPYCGVVQDKVQMVGVTSRGFHIKARRYKDHNKTYFLGKSAFLTREEAEAALPQPPKEG